MSKAKQKQKIDYIKFIGCKTAEEVFELVRQSSSDMSDHEHAVRSVILDIHARIEAVMKEILFQTLAQLVACYTGAEAKHKDCRSRLERTIQKMSFSQVHRLLAPCFEAFESGELTEYLPAIDALRNEVAHRSGKTAKYKGRSPFSDPDCFAQVFIDGCHVRQELGEFIERRIDDPKAMQERGWLHFAGRLH